MLWHLPIAWECCGTFQLLKNLALCFKKLFIMWVYNNKKKSSVSVEPVGLKNFMLANGLVHTVWILWKQIIFIKTLIFLLHKSSYIYEEKKNWGMPRHLPTPKKIRPCIELNAIQNKINLLRSVRLLFAYLFLKR
jgi:hypothetical protein